MHGCPPDEIEKIAAYLLSEQQLHTAVKLNPTLLGPEKLRSILNQIHQFPVVVPDEAFEHDIKYSDAVSMIENLIKLAEREQLEFGLKLTNTLESLNQGNRLPKEERMHYMSGRALHPLSIQVARSLQETFDGHLDLSFCGGVDCFNVVETLKCGLAPVTVCTDLLKPGGYGRTKQYIEAISAWEEYPWVMADRNAQFANLRTYADRVLSQKQYTKTPQSYFTIKNKKELHAFDCISAPCEPTCPAHQEIPKYMRAVANGDFDLAHDIIMRTNPFPGVTGLVCDHICQTKCTRINYDSALLIREIKRFAEENQHAEHPLAPPAESKGKAAIIGAGPCGLTAAYELKKAGLEVDIYDSKKELGGMVSGTIPPFRLTEEAIHKDLNRILELGVRVHSGQRVSESQFIEIRKTHDCTLIAIGAANAKKLGLPGDTALGVSDQLHFLEQLRRGHSILRGKHVVVLGGGNSAIDAARTASRLIPEDGSVTVLYRRTIREMPAEIEEIEALGEEKVNIIELAAPLSLLTEDGQLTGIICQKMKLGAVDSSGRRSPIPLEGRTFKLRADSLISAFGQNVDLDFAQITEVNPETLETNLKGVFMGGDAYRGASTVIRAVADGRIAAKSMLQCADLNPEHVKDGDFSIPEHKHRHLSAATRIQATLPKELPLNDRKNFHLVRGSLSVEDAMKEAARCLSCDLHCDICVTVCPNRANFTYASQPGSWPVPEIRFKGKEHYLIEEKEMVLSQESQVLNIGDFCNECGNCTTFCPTSGDPYKDKPKFYLSRQSFENETSGYYLEGSCLEAKSQDRREKLQERDGVFLYQTEEIIARFSTADFKLLEYELLAPKGSSVSLDGALKLLILYQNLKNTSFKKIGVPTPAAT
ncbi:MAG: putative selenate reductase subunit YgfK [Acidobacteria bacterium]|nr:MAG: putative selenate reductase subunit YgfK [Acidobacteriota bacterium]